MEFGEYDSIIRPPSYDPGGNYTPTDSLPIRSIEPDFAPGDPRSPVQWPDVSPSDETPVRFIFDPDNDRRIWVDRDRQDGRLEPLDLCNRCYPGLSEVFLEGEFWNEEPLCDRCISDLNAAKQNEDLSPLEKATLWSASPPYSGE